MLGKGIETGRSGVSPSSRPLHGQGGMLDGISRQRRVASRGCGATVGAVDKAGQEPGRAGGTIRDSGGVSRRRLGIDPIRS